MMKKADGLPEIIDDIDDLPKLLDEESSSDTSTPTVQNKEKVNLSTRGWGGTVRLNNLVWANHTALEVIDVSCDEVPVNTSVIPNSIFQSFKINKGSMFSVVCNEGKVYITGDKDTYTYKGNSYKEGNDGRHYIDDELVVLDDARLISREPAKTLVFSGDFKGSINMNFN